MHYGESIGEEGIFKPAISSIYKHIEEIKIWVQKALDTMAESEKWFGADGFLVYAEKDEEYMEWLVATNCSLNKQ